MPNYYAEVNRDGRVVGISELAGEVKAESLIPITKELFDNQNVLFTRYVDDQFVGFYTVLEADRSILESNGVDFITIKARVYDWKNTLHTMYSQEVVFEVNGLQQAVKARKGVAELTLSSEEPGEFVVRTTNFDQNGDVKVVVEYASEKA